MKAASVEASTQCTMGAATRATQCSVESLPKSVQWYAVKESKSVQVAFVSDLSCGSLDMRRQTAPGLKSCGGVREREEERRQRLPMQAGPRCAVCNIQRTRNTVLHPLPPACHSHRQRWIEFVRQCPGGGLRHWTPPEHEQSFICSLHFVCGCFSRKLPEKRLRRGAIPTLYPKATHVSAVEAVTAPEDCAGTRLSDVQVSAGFSVSDGCWTSAISADQPDSGSGHSAGGAATKSRQSCAVKEESGNVEVAFVADLPGVDLPKGQPRAVPGDIPRRRKRLRREHCCVVHGCSLRWGTNLLSRAQTFPFPKDNGRRSAWITVVQWGNWQPMRFSRICSAHFVQGRLSKDVSHPDFVPSVFPSQVQRNTEETSS